ncbi:MAG: type II toxin-antitoxin system RelE/ParE family toxin [Ignavibacteriales bacterium]|nr:type II toxin-antitoxin system RelE/ParE family toxin [Ignavibacteriales bacterium]
MNVEYRKQFLRELAKIPSSHRIDIENFVFHDLLSFKTLTECKKIERMKGYPGFYKVRFGDYRVGLYIESDTLVLERVLHRKEIYRYFP